MRKNSFPKLKSDHAGLRETLNLLDQRRRFLKGLAGIGGAVAMMPLGRALACNVIEEETSGPYPGDGTNGPNVLTQTGILRSDIRTSFGSAGTASAAGILNTVTLKLVSTTSTSCGLVQGLAVYLWHCNNTGSYSMYSGNATAQNYLRGVQVTDENGEVSFTSFFPGCYSGRWPHIHFEIYASVADATSGTNAIRTSQLALPESTCRTVFSNTTLYPNSTSNLNSTSIAKDNVFGDDDAAYELATCTGDNTNGYATYLEVGVGVDSTSDMIFEGGFESA